jgi:hypothetical protein
LTANLLPPLLRDVPGPQASTMPLSFVDSLPGTPGHERRSGILPVALS